MKRRRSSAGEAESERTIPVRSDLPVPVQPVQATGRTLFPDRYRPNSPFLAHLIATWDAEGHAPYGWQAVPQFGTSAYRATAAAPRRRSSGHVISRDF
ncbi:hypothetical protein [Polymorphum gilvum]|uniref:Uncharacterized protein n=1 Tax=Polymorphum gilvum (strain LMG 25793 / CGMCC 1.9160 / SL003B-26A1) TaxID=991905 RepID=F2J0A2_POLGS|nr:hypothetical protein [Polymorphum gilvum]ADZ68637.1 hypothetical protein SL003B_0198 [Polymorphum gilvum SL003B-26A1]